MGQIVRRKRKGRPPKPDLSRRSPSPPPDEVRTVRRSHRRRNVRYSSFIDYDDYIDDDDYFELDRGDEEVLRDEDDEDVELRRGRKVKLVVKLSRRRRLRGGRAAESGDSGSEAGAAATDGDDEEAEEEEEEEEEGEGDSGSERRVLKKRRISGRDEEDDYLDDNYPEDDYGGCHGEEEVRVRWMNCLANSSNWSSCSGETLPGESRVSTSDSSRPTPLRQKEQNKN